MRVQNIFSPHFLSASSKVDLAVIITSHQYLKTNSKIIDLLILETGMGQIKYPKKRSLKMTKKSTIEMGVKKGRMTYRPFRSSR